MGSVGSWGSEGSVGILGIWGSTEPATFADQDAVGDGGVEDCGFEGGGRGAGRVQAVVDFDPVLGGGFKKGWVGRGGEGWDGRTYEHACPWRYPACDFGG